MKKKAKPTTLKKRDLMQIISMIKNTAQRELTCGECFDELEQYAEYQ